MENVKLVKTTKIDGHDYFRYAVLTSSNELVIVEVNECSPPAFITYEFGDDVCNEALGILESQGLIPEGESPEAKRYTKFRKMWFGISGLRRLPAGWGNWGWRKVEDDGAPLGSRGDFSFDRAIEDAKAYHETGNESPCLNRY